jgi:AcrR family transcriptional regulator
MNDDHLIIPDQRPTRSDAVKNRELLIETARRLFEQSGVETVSMTQIAQEAGVGKGTLYRHFRDKTAICHALLDHEQRELQLETLRRTRSDAEPLDTLRWFLTEVAQFVARNGELLQVVPESGRMLSLQIPAHIWWRQTIRGLLRQIEVCADLDYLTDVLYVMLDINTIAFQLNGLGYSPERIISGLHLTLDRLVRLEA